jgi:putative two-component system response regulator
MLFHAAPPTILVADDTDTVRSLFAQLLAGDQYRVITASDGAEALALALAHLPDVCLLDVRMPGLDGVEVCRQLKSAPETRLTPVILVTGLADAHDRLVGIEAGADDFLTKPVNPHELRARVRALSRMKQLIDELDSAEAAFMTLALTIEARDPSTNGHCERLAHYAVALGSAIGLEGDDLGALHRGGYLHDVGKVGVPDAVLLKPGPITG